MVEQITQNIIAGVITLLVLCGVIVGVAAFKQSELTRNTGINCGQNATGGADGKAYTNCGAAYNLTRSTETMTNNFGKQLGTVGTMLGVALILGAIGLLGYGIYTGARKVQ